VRHHFVYLTKKQERRVISENTFGRNKSYLAVGYLTSSKNISGISVSAE